MDVELTDTVREVLLKGIVPMLGGVLLVLAGLYGFPGDGGQAGGWDAVLEGSLVVAGMMLLLVPLFLVVIPHLLPRE